MSLGSSVDLSATWTFRLVGHLVSIGSFVSVDLQRGLVVPSPSIFRLVGSPGSIGFFVPLDLSSSCAVRVNFTFRVVENCVSLPT